MNIVDVLYTYINSLSRDWTSHFNVWVKCIYVSPRMCFSVYPCIFSVYLCSLFRSLCFESVKPHKTLTWLFLLRYSKVCTTSAVSRYDTIRYIYHLTLCYQSLYVCLCVCVFAFVALLGGLFDRMSVRLSVVDWDVSHSVQVIYSRCWSCCFCRLMLFVILTYFFFWIITNSGEAKGFQVGGMGRGVSPSPLGVWGLCHQKMFGIFWIGAF